MKRLAIAAAVTMMTAAPLFAQEQAAGGPDAPGYITGMGGFATSVGKTTGDFLLEPVARRISVRD